MATLRQIEASRQNGERGIGPTTDAGKGAIRGNAYKHGMSGDGPVTMEAIGAAFTARRSAWAETYRPVGDFADWVLDRAVSASFRIELCERSLDAQASTEAFRAAKLWDTDRGVEAVTVAGRLAGAPERVARQLETTPHGCAVLLQTWDRLDSALEATGAWDDLDSAIALDLLGVPLAFRGGRTPLDAPAGVEPAEHHRRLVRDESARLLGLQETLLPIDEHQRQLAEAGSLCLLSKPARLIRRYERDAWRQLRDSVACLERLTAEAAVAHVESVDADVPTEPAEAPPEPATVAVAVAVEAARPPAKAVAPRPSARPSPMDDAPAFTYLDIAITPSRSGPVPVG